MNPYLPHWEYVPDGEPHVFDGRLYLFGSHDRFNGKSYCEKNYVVWSAPVDDLSQWRCEGVSFRREQEPKCKGITAQLWAPDVCRGPDGKYYMYYSAAFANWIGVARADRPAGPYEYLGKLRYPDGTLYGKKKGDLPFDPGVFVDDDGKAWLYTGFATPSKRFQWMLRCVYGLHVTGKCSFVMELEPDMMTIRSHRPCLPGPLASEGTGFEGHAFFEASSMRKFDGKYYYFYSTQKSHELGWAVSDHPDRDFVFGGILHSNGNIGFGGNVEPEYPWGNNHGAVERVNGEYYVFGHRQTNYSECSRQGVAERIRMDAQGRFHQAEMTSLGMRSEPFCASGCYPASMACVLLGKSGTKKITLLRRKKNHPMITQDLPDGNPSARQYICNLCDGAVVGYKYFNFTGECRFSLRLRNTQAGQIAVFQEKGKAPVAVLDIPRTAGWTSIEAVVPFAKGLYPLYLEYRGVGSADLMELGFAE